MLLYFLDQKVLPHGHIFKYLSWFICIFGMSVIVHVIQVVHALPHLQKALIILFVVGVCCYALVLYWKWGHVNIDPNGFLWPCVHTALCQSHMSLEEEFSSFLATFYKKVIRSFFALLAISFWIIFLAASSTLLSHFSRQLWRALNFLDFSSWHL